MKIASIVIWAALAAGGAAAQQEGIRLAFGGGRVTIEARDALASDVLAVWAHTGRVHVTGSELLGPRRVTLSLQDVDEKQALQAIVGDTAAFVARWKLEAIPSASRFARIAIGDPQQLALDAAAPALDPEARYSYYQSLKQIGPNLGQTKSPPIAGALPVPESVYEYSVPAKANGPKLQQGDARIDPSLGDPEARFKYFVPAKARR